jgi:hypothetical protein
MAAAVWQCGRRAFGDLAYPTGGHYAAAVARIDARARNPVRPGHHPARSDGGKADYDERYILHAPEERLLFNGHWQDGFIPTEGVPPGNWRSTSASLPKCGACARRMATMARVFVFPTVESSQDPAWQALEHHLEAVDGARRLYLAHAALVSQLLLPRRLRHALRPGIGMGRPALLLQPLGPGGQCRQWRLADLAGRHAAGRPAMEQASGVKRMAGTVVSLTTTSNGVEALCFNWSTASRQLPGQGAQGHLRHADCMWRRAW